MNVNQTIKDRLLSFIREKSLSQARFEKSCGLSNGYINNCKGNIGAKKLEDILRNFPELNREWLLFGEGDMLNVEGAVQTSTGDNNIQVSGNENSIDTSSASLVDKALNEISEQRKLVAKSQEQIDRLISLLERK